jgi:hypothetical protein
MFHNRKGEMRFDGSWRMPALGGDAVSALIAENRERGAGPGAWSASARWKREGDVPEDVISRASEAI